jgi:hypothetical protein
MIVNTFLYEAMVKPVKSGPEVVSFCAVVRRILYNAFCFLELQNLAESWIFVHCDNTAIARGVIADGLAFGAGPVAGTVGGSIRPQTVLTCCRIPSRPYRPTLCYQA